MAKTNEPTIIKKYANRRLYNTGTSTYVTLEDLAVMVKGEEDFIVYDAKTGDDITRSVLTQIIFEQEGKGQNLLPVPFLRQLIRFYGDSMQGLVPSFLEYSMTSLTQEQDKLRAQMTDAFGATAFDAIEDQVKRNAEMFERAMKMFMPFSAGDVGSDSSGDGAAAPQAAKTEPSDLDDMKRQLTEMQAKINALSDKS
ncbi:polyhydroxyalkanoate synthesis repressor PhaR [Roseibium polysiphoniae]|uniref:Polyhydroxyalkanoate synthesis repressor PhaR n=1 Tax=Roseibium polysiphoniae TaxID=2571221 RepID=A0A944CFT8_9HYPH|nr:polyhydroxyalkanoate synthesis repressor PhaR [Roseibium polysiphoniae]MBS8261874.1 polyhydroxyalkanoate synthesis repressor PhaR [Roseibium polysiphoniae]